MYRVKKWKNMTSKVDNEKYSVLRIMFYNLHVIFCTFAYENCNTR